MKYTELLLARVHQLDQQIAAARDKFQEFNSDEHSPEGQEAVKEVAQALAEADLLLELIGPLKEFELRYVDSPRQPIAPAFSNN